MGGGVQKLKGPEMVGMSRLSQDWAEDRNPSSCSIIYYEEILPSQVKATTPALSPNTWDSGTLGMPVSSPLRVAASSSRRVR